MTVAVSLPTAAPRRGLWRFGRPAGLALLILLLGFLTLYPMAMLFYGSLHSTPPGIAGTFNLDGYAGLASAENLAVIANTAGLSLIKTVLSLALAILLAWIVARTDTPARGLLEVLITLPFFIPPILTATAWAMLGNAQVGTINLAWRWLTHSDRSLVDVYSYGGVIWHMMQYSTPFIFLFVVDAFRAMDPSLEESSRMSGATRWQTFWRITFALMLPITTSAFILSFIRGMESFESAVFFGTPVGINVITTQIYNLITQRAQPDYQSATALGFAAMALMFLLLVLQGRLLGGRSFTTVTGKGYQPNVTRLGWLRWVTFAICIGFFALTVVLPVGQLLLSSFFQFFGFYQADMLTLDHYRNVWDNSEFWRALGNTMLLGFVGATRDHAAGRHRGLHHHAHALARPAADRHPRLAALDDAGHGAGHRLPVGLRHPAARHPDLRHAVGAAAGLCRTRHAGRGARHVGRLRADRHRHRGMQPRPWRELLADAGPHPGGAGVARLRGRLGADLLRHHARALAPRSCSMRPAPRCCRW